MFFILFLLCYSFCNVIKYDLSSESCQNKVFKVIGENSTNYPIFTSDIVKTICLSYNSIGSWYNDSIRFTADKYIDKYLNPHSFSIEMWYYKEFVYTLPELFGLNDLINNKNLFYLCPDHVLITKKDGGYKRSNFPRISTLSQIIVLFDNDMLYLYINTELKLTIEIIPLEFSSQTMMLMTFWNKHYIYGLSLYDYILNNEEIEDLYKESIGVSIPVLNNKNINVYENETILINLDYYWSDEIYLTNNYKNHYCDFNINIIKDNINICLNDTIEYSTQLLNKCDNKTDKIDILFKYNDIISKNIITINILPFQNKIIKVDEFNISYNDILIISPLDYICGIKSISDVSLSVITHPKGNLIFHNEKFEYTPILNNYDTCQNSIYYSTYFEFTVKNDIYDDVIKININLQCNMTCNLNISLYNNTGYNNKIKPYINNNNIYMYENSKIILKYYCVNNDKINEKYNYKYSINSNNTLMIEDNNYNDYYELIYQPIDYYYNYDNISNTIILPFEKIQIDNYLLNILSFSKLYNIYIINTINYPLIETKYSYEFIQNPMIISYNITDYDYLLHTYQLLITSNKCNISFNDNYNNSLNKIDLNNLKFYELSQYMKCNYFYFENISESCYIQHVIIRNDFYRISISTSITQPKKTSKPFIEINWKSIYLWIIISIIILSICLCCCVIIRKSRKKLIHNNRDDDYFDPIEEFNI